MNPAGRCVRDVVGRLALALMTLLATSCAQPPHREGAPVNQGDQASGTKRIGEAEAIRIAEAFVADNGYTDRPATRAGADVSRESIDDDDPAERLRNRKNTLKAKACRVAPGDAWSKGDGWTVVFCYNTERYRDDPEISRLIVDRGRAVVMGPDGRDPRILHVNIALDAAGFRRLD
jgi:hypothetical protein